MNTLLQRAKNEVAQRYIKDADNQGFYKSWDEMEDDYGGWTITMWRWTGWKKSVNSTLNTE